MEESGTILIMIKLKKDIEHIFILFNNFYETISSSELKYSNLCLFY